MTVPKWLQAKDLILQIIGEISVQVGCHGQAAARVWKGMQSVTIKLLLRGVCGGVQSSIVSQLSC